MAKYAAIALFPVLVVGGAVMNTSVVLVDVQQPDAPHVVAPVPLPIARAALHFASEEARRVRAPQLAEHLPLVERLLDELREAPEGVFVEVHEPGQFVLVAKEGDILRIQATDGEASVVDVRVPLGSVEAALRAYDAETGSFDTSELIGSLKHAPRGDLVQVEDGEQKVRIKMW